MNWDLFKRLLLLVTTSKTRATPPPPKLQEEKLSKENFEQSPLRFEYDVMMEEYRSIRGEILVRVQAQQQVVNFAIALIAGVVALIQFIPGDSKLATIRPLYPFLSVLFSTFSLAYMEQDLMMAHLGGYLMHHLTPRMK